MKKVIKILGNILTIAAIVFLIKKFLDMDIDAGQLSSPEVIAAMLISIAAQTIIVIANSLPWLNFSCALSGKRISYGQAIPIFVKSNLYKYVPGNIFQYVGRNRLAVENNISHIDVACATVLDILFCVLATGCIAVILLGDNIKGLAQHYADKIILVGSIAAAAVIITAIFLYSKFKEKCKEYLSRYAKAFNKKSMPHILFSIAYYFIQNCFSAFTYFAALQLILSDSVSTDKLITLTGAFLFAWIIGFITPGAPGGIGIRESVMLFISGKEFEEKILLFVLVMRIASIIADILSFSIVVIYGALKKRKSTNTLN